MEFAPLKIMCKRTQNLLGECVSNMIELIRLLDDNWNH
jgi:hypothetical protein